MNADRISTTGQIVLKSETYDTNTASGGGSTRVYTGPRALILAQRLTELGFGASITKIEPTGDGSFQLTSSYTWDISQGANASSPPISSHELENSMEQVSVWTNPVLRANFLSTFSTWANANVAISFTARLAEKFISANDESATAMAAAELKITTAYGGAQQALVLDAFRGVAYHQASGSIQFNSIYRRRITAASYNQVQAGFVGANKIWTTAEILSFENVPSTWWFQLPSTYVWLKSAPIVVTIAGQKTEISYSYLAIAEAWRLLYTAYGSATLLSF